MQLLTRSSRPASRHATLALALGLAGLGACASDPATVVGTDPDTAPVVAVDRFTPATGATLMVRDAANGLPAANAPIDFDKAPFITTGFRPEGGVAHYYNFDVRPAQPAPIYVFFKPGATAPVAGQLNVIDVVPGDAGYNDFWLVTKVQVPADYVANSVTSVAELDAMGFTKTSTTMLVNCPVVPAGSTATRRHGGGAAGLQRGWYKDQIVNYFSFEEASLTLTAGMIPRSPIYVTFNANPDQPSGGPSSGFRTEPGSAQTHNVIATMPGDAQYSPLWSVNVYDNADFGTVANLATAKAAKQLAADVATVNCPVVD
jgi:hypothetical protein